SPTKAKTITKFLPKEYKVESSYGHVRDLPRGAFGVDVENNFQPQYVVPMKSKKRVNELKKIATKADEVILASDEDREGEAIAWHLEQIVKGKVHGKRMMNVDKELQAKNLPIKRIVFHEITKSAILNALEHPREIQINMVDAQQARRVMDRIVGYQLSPFLWQKVAKGLSAGRVQSVALRLIVDRENEIRAFKPEEYWTVEANLQTDKKEIFSAELKKINSDTLNKFDIPNEKRAKEIEADLKGASFKVLSVKEADTKRSPSPPFTTSTLQQQAGSRLGFSAKRTMTLAQMLYENGLITYMRTDSVNLSKESLNAAKNYLENEFGKEYALESPRYFKGKSKLAQEAHEAIRPTGTAPAEAISVQDEGARKLYRLIWQRFMASQMPEARFKALKVEIEAKGSENYTLNANGNRLVFDGFLKVFSQKFEEKDLPKLEEGQALEAKDIIPNQHFTEPPPRYSEARLIKTLEEYGIGRPSTYVPTISTIQARNYVEKDAGKFKPTEIGEMVNKLLVEHFPQIVDFEFTANMEERFDEIAEGKEQWYAILQDFYGPFKKNLDEKLEEVDKEHTEEITDEKCDKCEKPMAIKFGRFGQFLACTGFPDCKNAKPLKKNEPKKTGVQCPECDGELVMKFTRTRGKRPFFGCSKYPECDFATWTDPAKEKPVARTEAEKQTSREKRAAREAKRKKK
ncbi:MAG: type I DNA topoisomerase, partial [bacterium]|nr:type I DNA topoisomerase [bacterium]